MKAVRKNKKSNKVGKIVLATAILVYFGFTFVQQEIRIHDLKNTAINISEEITQQQQEQEKIQNQMNEQSELERIEKVARDKLGFLRGNERVFVDSSAR